MCGTHSPHLNDVVTRVKPSRQSNLIDQIRLELVGVRPAIWHSLSVLGSIKLHKFDRVIQAAFGWTNSRLHEFQFFNARFGRMAFAQELDGQGALASAVSWAPPWLAPRVGNALTFSKQTR